MSSMKMMKIRPACPVAARSGQDQALGDRRGVRARLVKNRPPMPGEIRVAVDAVFEDLEVIFGEVRDELPFASRGKNQW